MKPLICPEDDKPCTCTDDRFSGRGCPREEVAFALAKKLSPTQSEVIARMRAAGGYIERWPGGFWTTPGMRYELKWGGVKVPEWSVAWNTVNALAKRGLIRETKRQNTWSGSFSTEYEVVP